MLQPPLSGSLHPCKGVEQQTHLTPTRPLLEAIPDLLWSFTNSQVLLHVSAVPLLLLEHHPQHVILCQSVLWGPASLLEGIGSDQKVGTCNSRCSQLESLSSMRYLVAVTVSAISQHKACAPHAVMQICASCVSKRTGNTCNWGMDE